MLADKQFVFLRTIIDNLFLTNQQGSIARITKKKLIIKNVTQISICGKNSTIKRLGILL